MYKIMHDVDLGDWNLTSMRQKIEQKWSNKD